MNRKERNTKLKHFITCLKCEVSGRECNDNCPVQYKSGNMGEIIENLEAITKALEQEPCEDAISREAAIKAVYGMYRYTGIDEAPYEYAEHVISDLPPVTPQPKTGHWISSRCDMYECSECGMTYTDLSCGDNMANFCPYCGCAMFEPQESEGKG